VRARWTSSASSATCFFNRAFSVRTRKKLPIPSGTLLTPEPTQSSPEETGVVTSENAPRTAAKAPGLKVESSSRTAPTNMPAPAKT
jgi:hypothetical protein